MKATFRRIAVGVIVILVLNFAVFSIAKASATSQSYNGITTAYAEKSIMNYSTHWDTKLWSKSKSPAINMDDIGYSWWTIREKCNGVITNQVQYGGHVLHNTPLYYSATTMTKRTCSGYRLGESLGNHDYYEYPYSHLYLYLSSTTNIP